jgi:riboflavin biosynthesis pyrimidine reductase
MDHWSTLFGALLEADCVDELCLTVSPSIEAGDAPRIAAGELE